MLYMKALQRKLSSTSIICLSLHPGVVNTSLSGIFRYQRLMSFVMGIFFKKPEEGSYTSCFAAASPTVRESAEKYKGAYFMPVGVITQPSPNSQRMDLQEELWETTEKYLVGELK